MVPLAEPIKQVLELVTCSWVPNPVILSLYISALLSASSKHLAVLILSNLNIWVFWMRWGGKKKWASWAVPQIAGEIGHSLTLHSFPSRRNCGLRGFHLDNELCCLRGGVTQVVILFLPFLIDLFSKFLFQWCAGTSLLYSWTPTVLLLSLGGCQNQCSSRIIMAENFYSAILLMSLQ